MDQRDKLVEMLSQHCGSVEDLADRLISSGVVVLPCKVGDTVYTVGRVPCPCEVCEIMGRTDDTKRCFDEYISMSPADDKRCPVIYEVREGIADGFEIINNGLPRISDAGEWTEDGLISILGDDGKQYFTRSEAEKARARMEAKKSIEGEADK